MAFFFQLQGLRKEVQQQLASIEDEKEKGTSHQSNSQSSREHDSNSDGGESGKSSNNDSGHAKRSNDPYLRIPGVELKNKEDGSEYYLVGWNSPNDPRNPQNWSYTNRGKTTLLLFLIAFMSTAASSIDSAVAVPAAKEFGVAAVTEALGGTAIFLIGFGVGSLLSSPLSELIGRFPTYLGTLVVFGIWLMASALSPNIGAQIAFRGLAGLCSSAPLTVAGGTISDIWNPKEKTWAFPVFGIAGFGGPIIGPVIGAYIGYSKAIDWRWSDWIMLVFDGLVIFAVAAFKEETLAPRLLKYKAYFFRKYTGNSKFLSASEATGETLTQILWRNFTRPFVLSLEPIIIAFTLYLTIVYIILFTFLDGYPYIFEMVYGINPGLTFICFLGLFVGVLSQLAVVPFVYKRTVQQLNRDGDEGQGLKLDRESRLLFAMIGAPAVPIGLFWMAWTDYPSISIWSPIIASVVIGFGIISIFLSAYMYIIDSYEVVAASALTFVTLIRYLAAGGMTVVGVPMYENLGPHYTLTILACISAAVVPIPYALHKWGPKIREKSQYAVSPGT